MQREIYRHHPNRMGGRGVTVAELIAKLQEMPQDKEVIMFDGPSQYTPYKVEVADWGGKNIKGKVIID